MSPETTHKPTRTPDWTPLPTLLPSEAMNFVAELLKTNQDCQLPCWWGIVPGETKWTDAKRFLESFAYGGPTYMARDMINGMETTRFPLPEVVDYEFDFYQNYFITDGVIESIEIAIPGSTPTYLLMKFLENYGQPDEILISGNIDPDLDTIFTLVLYYREGYSMVYFNLEFTQNNDLFQICVENANPPILIIWSANNPKSINDVVNQWVRPETWKTMPILDGIGMSIETFVETLSDPDGSSCFKTPIGLWR